MNNLVTLRPTRSPLHLSGLRAPGGLSVNPLIWQLRKSPVSEERDRESGVVHARLSESNLCRAGAPPAAKIWGTDAVAYANDKRFLFVCRRVRCSAFDVRCWMSGVSAETCSLLRAPQCLAGTLQFLDLVAERFLGFAEFLLKTSQ
jgi:hypothetical protein